MPRPLAALAFVLAACGSAVSPTPEQPTEPGPGGGGESARSADEAPSAAMRFTYLEDRLLGARSVRIHYTATARGPFSVDVSGELVVVPPGRTLHTANGEFGAAPLNMRAVSDGTTLHITGASPQPTPSSLAEAYLIGFTRMGVMHNVSRINGHQPPDHAEGGVRDWVQVTNVAADGDDLTYSMVVGGQPSGDARLTLDANGLPARREVRVRFEDGSVMEVAEVYERFELDAPVDGATFTAP